MQFDEPVGHNDGSVKGMQVFTCPAGYGAFVRGSNITVGDYPERDIFGSDEDQDDLKTSAKPEPDDDEI